MSVKKRLILSLHSPLLMLFLAILFLFLSFVQIDFATIHISISNPLANQDWMLVILSLASLILSSIGIYDVLKQRRTKTHNTSLGDWLFISIIGMFTLVFILSFIDSSRGHPLFGVFIDTSLYKDEDIITALLSLAGIVLFSYRYYQYRKML